MVSALFSFCSLLKVGDVCRAEARIVSVINSDSGKIVKVRDNVPRDGQPVVMANSSFLFCGRFTDNTFEIVDGEPEYIVSLTDTSLVAPRHSTPRRVNKFLAPTSRPSRIVFLHEVPCSPPSALLTAAKAGNVSIYGLFGSQGTNEVYFDELQSLFDIYRPYVTDLIAVITKDVPYPLQRRRLWMGSPTAHMD
jgi:hypothetical protein